jgi:3-dehydroquinate synthase
MPDLLNRFASDKKHTSSAYTLILAASSGAVTLEQIPRSSELDRALERAIASTIETYSS